MSKSLSGKSSERSSGIELDEFTKSSKRPPLTQKEQIVFYGLIKFPELNDQKLSRKLKLKRSTITAIRNKLRRQNFYSPHIIPNFKLLGYELMTFIWGQSSFSAPLDEKIKISAIKAMQSPENILQIMTDNEFFSLLVFKNFTDFKKMQHSHSHIYENSSNEGNIHIIHFPFETSEIISLFDYSPYLKNLLNLELEFEEKEIKPKLKTLLELKKSEKMVFGALIKYPELNDMEISKKIDITRQTVSKIKLKLINQGAIKLVNEPNLKKIGCELFVNIYTRFNPQISQNERRSFLERLKKKYPMVINIENDVEEICTGFFEDYLSFKIMQDELMKDYKQKNLLLREPVTQIIPIQQIKFHRTNFVSSTEKALDIKIP